MSSWPGASRSCVLEKFPFRVSCKTSIDRSFKLSGGRHFKIMDDWLFLCPDKLSFHEWMYKLTSKDNIISYLVDPATSSFKQCPQDLIILWEQLCLLSRRENKYAWVSFYFLEFSFLLQNPHSAPLSTTTGATPQLGSKRYANLVLQSYI